MMQFDAIGDQLALYLWNPDQDLPGEPTVSVQGATIPGPGRIALGVIARTDPTPSPHEGRFRYVQVATTSIPEPSSRSVWFAACLGVGATRLAQAGRGNRYLW